jgi:hypothetical protein
VLDAASVLVDRRARRAKTDRLDAAGLLRTLMALERGETQVCRVVHVPSPEQEDARRRSRERARLVVERGQHTSRVKGLLMTQGIRDFEPTRRDWQARLEALRTPDGQPLAPRLRAELLRECRRLRQVMEMVTEVEAEQRRPRRWRTATPPGSRACAASGPPSRGCLARRCSSATSATGARWAAISASPRARGRAAGSGAIRASPSRATRGRQAYRDRTGLAVAAPPARQRARTMVPRARGRHQGAHAPDHAGGDGEEADRVAVALRDHWRCAGGRRAEGLTGSPRLSLGCSRRSGMGVDR